MNRLLTLLVSTLTLVSCGSSPYTLTSTSSNLSVSLNDLNGELSVELHKVDGQSREAVLASSPISITIDGVDAKWSLVDSEKSEVSEVIPMPYGEFSQVDITYSDMVCGVKVSAGEVEVDGTLTVRLFENAFAYRVELKDMPASTKLSEVSSWVPANLAGGCFSTNGEHEPLGPLSISEANQNHKTPLIYSDGANILAFNECDLFDYPQLVMNGAEDGSAINFTLDEVVVGGDVSLPWRLAMVGETFEDLHNQKPIYQALSRPAEGDFSWVKPGISMWDWRVKGTTFDGFTYKMDTESLKRYIDFCSKSNIAYFLLDDEWFKRKDPLTPVDALDLREVVRYGDEKGVGIILYYDLTYTKRGIPAIDFEVVADTYADLGVAGMKYGFLSAPTSQEKTRLTHKIITELAKRKLIVDFHDQPVPFSGLERTYPNYITREYCHAQLDRRAAFIPRSFVKMACVNFLAGHMDQTNGTYALHEMASRSKGPKNEYYSTVAAETARFVVTYTGSLSVLIDAPEAYAKKSDLFEVVASVPKSWDETRYLDMNYNSHVAVAKRKDDRWFAAVVFNETGGEYELDLDFLEKGYEYVAKIYRDAEDTDYITNKESYTIETKEEVSAYDTIKVNVPAGGGFTVIFDKM